MRQGGGKGEQPTVVDSRQIVGLSKTMVARGGKGLKKCLSEPCQTLPLHETVLYNGIMGATEMLFI